MNDINDSTAADWHVLENLPSVETTAVQRTMLPRFESVRSACVCVVRRERAALQKAVEGDRAALQTVLEPTLDRLRADLAHLGLTLLDEVLQNVAERVRGNVAHFPWRRVRFQDWVATIARRVLADYERPPRYGAVPVHYLSPIQPSFTEPARTGRMRRYLDTLPVANDAAPRQSDELLMEWESGGRAVDVLGDALDDLVPAHTLQGELAYQALPRGVRENDNRVRAHRRRKNISNILRAANVLTERDLLERGQHKVTRPRNFAVTS